MEMVIQETLQFIQGVSQTIGLYSASDQSIGKVFEIDYPIGWASAFNDDVEAQISHSDDRVIDSLNTHEVGVPPVLPSPRLVHELNRLVQEKVMPYVAFCNRVVVVENGYSTISDGSVLPKT